jgi:uncharacterized protein (TIGR03382 family)
MRCSLVWVLVAFVSLVSPQVADAQVHIEDPLRSGSTGNVTGGSFDAEGWTVTAVDDRIWYPLPRLLRGSVEFTVANIRPANLPLADHEIFAMYEDGYGIGEPIEYAPAFRVNHYKGLVRIYGTAEPDRLGAMKLMWGMCPSGSPGYGDCACSSFFEEPFQSVPEWTGAPVRIRIEWGDGHTRLLRDGDEVVSIDWSESGLSFGPSSLHMMIGSPRNDGGLSAMPIGARFSDLVIDGVEGPLATCPGSVTPDAGMPIDAGTCAGVRPTADATAASWESGVYPDAGDLNVEGDGANPTAVVYLRFPPAGPVSRATLTLRTADGGSSSGGSGEICRVDSSFDEASLTWSSRPTVTTVCTGGARAVSASETVTFDVTSLVPASGDVVLAVVSRDGDGAHYLSRESGGCENGPRLAIEGVASPDAGPVLDASGLDGSVVVEMDAALDAGARTRGSDAGCGCGARRSPPPTFALSGLFVLLAIRRRR